MPRMVLVHDWLTGMRGGEKCLEVACRLWPESTLYTLFHRQGSVSSTIEQLQPQTSFLQRLPGLHHYYRYLLPLMPRAARWQLPPCDLVLSFSHCVAKSARPPVGVPHICYCFSPMRYAWHLREAYFGRQSTSWKDHFRASLLARLRAWDRDTAASVSHFVAISRTIQQRIYECYDRESTVIYPPVDTDFYTPVAGPREAYYLVVSAFAPYKRLDLAIAACRALGRRLVIIGTGQDRARLQSLADERVTFLGWQPDTVIRDHLRRCRALLFPGEEDFGIVPVEAMACGTPVVAFGRGGATETVLPLGVSRTPTGVWFPEQTVESLAEAMVELERAEGAFSPRGLRQQAERFAKRRFDRELVALVDRVLNERRSVRQAA